MYLPLLGLGAEWGGWVTTVIVWLLLAAITIAILARVDKNVNK